MLKTRKRKTKKTRQQAFFLRARDTPRLTYNGKKSALKSIQFLQMGTIAPNALSLCYKLLEEA